MFIEVILGVGIMGQVHKKFKKKKNKGKFSLT